MSNTSSLQIKGQQLTPIRELRDLPILRVETSFDMDLAWHFRFGLCCSLSLGRLRLSIQLLGIFSVGFKLLRYFDRNVGLLRYGLDRVEMATGWHPFPSLRANFGFVRWLAPLFPWIDGPGLGGWQLHRLLWLRHPS